VTLHPVYLVPAATVAPEQLKPWFTEAWADMWGPETPDDAPDVVDWLRGNGEERLIALSDSNPLALVALRHSGALLELHALAVAREARHDGIGAEIVWQCEQRTPAERARAIFPQANGYAFYFWLRAGYRPVFSAEHGRPGFNVVERALR
jgi:GNAT superfamily N-acetyltransferase